MPSAMFSEDSSLRTGPVRCAWRDYHRGQAAEAVYIDIKKALKGQN